MASLSNAASFDIFIIRVEHKIQVIEKNCVRKRDIYPGQKYLNPGVRDFFSPGWRRDLSSGGKYSCPRAIGVFSPIGRGICLRGKYFHPRMREYRSRVKERLVHVEGRVVVPGVFLNPYETWFRFLYRFYYVKNRLDSQRVNVPVGFLPGLGWIFVHRREGFHPWGRGGIIVPVREGEEGCSLFVAYFTAFCNIYRSDLTSPLDCLLCRCRSTLSWYQNDVTQTDLSEPLPLRRSRVLEIVDSVGTTMSSSFIACCERVRPFQVAGFRGARTENKTNVGS